MLNKETIAGLVSSVARSKNDTGSTEVQILLLTARVEQISIHLKKFPKDHHSRRGLLKLVGQRKTFVKYLTRIDKKRCDVILQILEARKK